MNTPNIRFKGFTDDWEQRKLGDIATSFDYGLNAAAKEYDGTNAYIRITDIDDDSHNFISEGITSPDTDLSKADDYRVAEGDILFARTGASVGKSYIYKPSDGIMYFAGFLIRARVKPEYDAQFVFQNTLTEAYSKYIAVTSQRSGQPGVNAQEYAEYEIMCPTKKEQAKIGEHFKNLDNLITLHQRKCDSLNAVKKYMLQKMFPQNGAKVPEIRFKGFTGDWEKRKLPEFVQFYNGQTYKLGDVQDDGVLVLRSSNVKNDEIVDADNVYLDKSVANAEQVRKGDIIVVVRNGSRALIGKHAEIKREMPNTVIGAFMTGIRSEHSSFVNALLGTPQFEREIEMNMGATINQITGYMFSKMAFMIPSGDEQDKIGAYFKGLDNLITLHQCKCDNLKELKKFMLQNMFP